RPHWIAASGAALGLLLASAAIRPSLAGAWFHLPASAQPLRLAAHQGMQIALILAAAEACLLVVAVFLVRRTPPPAREGILVGAVAASLLAGALVPGRGPLGWRLRGC